MTKFLLTGGSGFIAAHILEQLLQQGHTVVTTVRSEAKAAPIKTAHTKEISEGRLEIYLVPDIKSPGAFDEVVKSPGVEYVLHTASPFHYNWTDPKTELVDPAISGTKSILKAVHSLCPSVKRVVVTSSFASVMNAAKMTDSTVVYNEACWNPNVLEDIYKGPAEAYRVSKTLAERAAWSFIEEKEPSFDLATICPPLVFGPVAHHIESLDQMNESNKRIASLVRGGWRTDEGGIPATSVYFWIDVRDVAAAHIKAAMVPEAGGKRFFTTAGFFCHNEMIEAVRKHYPALEGKLPVPGAIGGSLPPKEQVAGYDNTRATQVLGMEWIGIEQCIVDTIRNFEEIEKLGI